MTRAQPPTRAQWFAQLSEWLPDACAAAIAPELERLRLHDGATPREAAAFARVCLRAARVDCDEVAASLPALAAPVDSADE